MDPWVVWLVVALGLGALEIVSGGTLVLLMLSGGALAGALTAGVTDNAILPWISFSVVSVGLLATVRPLARRHMSQTPELRSGTSRLIGADAEVLSEVTGRGGRVKLSGEVWSARSFNPEHIFTPGQSVQVIEIQGATALVD